jgi:hypothetical protein
MLAPFALFAFQDFCYLLALGGSADPRLPLRGILEIHAASSFAGFRESEESMKCRYVFQLQLAGFPVPPGSAALPADNAGFNFIRQRRIPSSI